MKLRSITDSSIDPFYNIALEHSLHHLTSEITKIPIVRFWKNTPSVIIGRVQDIHTEVNIEYCKNHEIPIIRRISGGGTVYHDLGNLNTSIIVPISKIPTNKNVQSFSIYFTELIKKTLIDLGVTKVSRKAKTNVFWEDIKVSGSAGHLRKGWFLHHATLLLSSDIHVLNKTLLARESHPDDPKASRYYPTRNLDMISPNQWQKAFIHRFSSEFDLNPISSEINATEENYALKLNHEMYKNDDWIYQGKRKLIKPNI